MKHDMTPGQVAARMLGEREAAEARFDSGVATEGDIQKIATNALGAQILRSAIEQGIFDPSLPLWSQLPRDAK